MVVEGRRKKLHHISFGCYPNDLPYLQERAEESGIELADPPKGFESNGFWVRDPGGLLVEIKVAAKTSPVHKTCGSWSSSPEGIAGAPVRPMRRSFIRAGFHTYWYSPPTSIGLLSSTPALWGCACRIAPIA